MARITRIALILGVIAAILTINDSNSFKRIIKKFKK
jgi:hypothetical protein